MTDTLEKISTIIDTYESGTWQSVDKLRVLLRELSTSYYHLTKYNIEAFNKHNEIQYRNKESVSKGLVIANELVPELRMTRKILYSTSKVIDAMRSEIGILRNEM